MSENPSTRSVKIGADERTGWSSERPRRDGAPPRPVDISEKCRVLRPTDRMRYSPGSIVIIAGPAAVGLDRFADRVVEERGVVLSLAKVRALLQGRVAEDELEDKAAELLDAAVQKRLGARQSIVIPVEGLEAENRERFVRPAHAARRPRHLILVDGSPDQVSDEERPAAGRAAPRRSTPASSGARGSRPRCACRARRATSSSGSCSRARPPMTDRAPVRSRPASTDGPRDLRPRRARRRRHAGASAARSRRS